MNNKIKYFLWIFLLSLSTSVYSQINYPGGRIALLHDGNFRDPDDIAALPMNLAILDAADLKDKLVYLEHSQLITKTTPSIVHPWMLNALV